MASGSRKVQQDDDGESLWIRRTATGEDRLIARSKPGVRIVGVTVTPDERYVDFIELEAGRPRAICCGCLVNDEAAPHLLVEDVHTPVAWSPTEPWRMAFIRRGTGADSSSRTSTGCERLSSRLRRIFPPRRSSSFPASLEDPANGSHGRPMAMSLRRPPNVRDR